MVRAYLNLKEQFDGVSCRLGLKSLRVSSRKATETHEEWCILEKIILTPCHCSYITQTYLEKEYICKQCKVTFGLKYILFNDNPCADLDIFYSKVKSLQLIGFHMGKL